MPQVKTRFGGEYHHIREIKPDMFITDCGIKVTSHFRYITGHKITCEKCLKNNTPWIDGGNKLSA